MIQPFQNAEQVIWKYNQAIQHNSLTQQGWQRLLAQSDDSLKAYLISIKGSTASMAGYNVSLQGSITGFTKVSNAIKQYNALGAVSLEEQQAFATAVSATNSKLGTYLIGLNGSTAGLRGYGVSLVASTAKTIGLTVATTALNAAMTMGISAIVTGLISAFTAWINKSEKITEKAQEAADKINSISESLKTNTETVENAKRRYAELAQEVENLGKITQSQGTLSNEEYEEFLDLSNQLAGIFPSLTKNYDENGNAILDLSGDVDTIVSSLDNLIQKEKELTNQKIMEEFPDVFKGYAQDVSGAEAKVKSAQTEFDKINNAYQQLAHNGSAVQAFDLDLNGVFINEDGKEVTITMNEYIQALEDLGIAYKKSNIWKPNQFGGKDLSGYLVEATGDIDTAFTSKLETARDNLQYAQQQLESEKSSIDSYLNTWLQGEFSYVQIEDSGLQTAIQNMLFNFDFSNIPENKRGDWNYVSEYLRRNILFEINKVQDDPAISKAISEVFTNAELTPDEKANYLQQIQDFFGEDSAIVISLKPQIEETDTLQKQYDNAITKTKDKFKSDFDWDSWFKENSINTQEEIDRWNEIAQAANSAAEAREKYVQSSISDDPEDLSSRTQTISDLVAGITSIQSVLNSQKNGKSISIEDFNSDELKDYQSALEYVNGTMQLNAEKVKEIAQAKADEQVAINNTNKALNQAKYLENAKKIERLRKSLKDLSRGKWFDSAAAGVINAQIDALLEENSVIAETCKQYDLLSYSMQEALGSYQHWLNAQNASDYGDMANDAMSAIQRIRDTYDSESDIFGNYGSKKFDAAVDFIVPDSVNSDDLSAIESYMDDFKKYLTFDDDGNATGLNIDKFLADSVEAGLMSYSEDDGFKVLGGKKMEDFAEGLNLSSGMVQAFFDELQLKGGEFDWSDEAVKTIGDLAIEANQAAESLRGLEGNENLKIKMDVSDLATADEQVAALDATIAEMDGIKAKPGVDSSEIDNANAVIQYCLAQKQLLTQPDIMRVDTSQVEGDMGNAISLLQQFQTTANEIEIQKKVGADTTEAQAKLDSLTTEIQALAPDIKAQLSLDTTSTENIQESINNLTAPMLEVDADINPEAIIGYNPEDKSCDVVYNPNTDLLPESFDDIDRTVNYTPVTKDLPETFLPLTRYVNYVNTGDTEGQPSVNGTAHVSGTAKAGGDWGTAPGGKTLVGELGQEIVVDPHTGRWYTVGDNGAEFRDIPAGAIVFNHIQSKALLKNGYVSGRASALVSGTAMVTGGYKPYKPTSSSYSNTSSSSSSSSSSSISDATEAAEEFKEILDWIERKIKDIERDIENFDQTASATYKSWITRNSALSEEISKVNQEISIQQQAYERYMQQANSVGLSDSYKKLVQEGKIDIESITDETLNEQIQEYQEW